MKPQGVIRNIKNWAESAKYELTVTADEVSKSSHILPKTVFKRNKLLTVGNAFSKSLTCLYKIESPTSRMKYFIMQLNKTLNTAIIELNVQKDNLDKYLKIAKKYRESLSNE